MLKSVNDEAIWQAVSQNDKVAIGLLRGAVMEMALRLDRLERAQPEKQPAAVVRWCEEA